MRIVSRRGVVANSTDFQVYEYEAYFVFKRLYETVELKYERQHDRYVCFVFLCALRTIERFGHTYVGVPKQTGKSK